MTNGYSGGTLRGMRIHHGGPNRPFDEWLDPGQLDFGKSGEVTVEIPMAPEGDGLWWISGTYLHATDGWVLAELRIFPGGSGRARRRRKAGEWTPTKDSLRHLEGAGVTAALLRQVSTTALDAYRSRALADLASDLDLGAVDLDVSESRRRPGRSGRDDLYYARWARTYVNAYGREPRATNKLLSEETGLSVTAVRDLNSRTRRRGMLESPKGRRAGGELTTKAKDLLAGEAEES